MTCLIAGLSAERTAMLERGLASAGGWDVRACSSVRELPDEVASRRPDLVVLGCSETDGDVHGALTRIVASTPDVPVIVVAAEHDSEVAAAALQAGAQDYLAGTTLADDHIAHAIERARLRQRFVARLRSDSWTDWLTGLLNRRGFDRCAADALRLADRTGSRLLLLAFDVDGLKIVNDQYGHSAGDEALRMVGESIRGSGRRSDVAARIGGDEFALVARGAGAAHAAAMRDRIRNALARRAEDAAAGWVVTVTAGWAEYVPNTEISLDALLDAADRHLYAEKAAEAARPGH